jgi:proline racemase
LRFSRSLTAIQAHAEGEQGHVIIGGPLGLPGRTAREKLHHLNAVDDSLRRFLCFEPRGCAQMSVDLVWPSADPEADAAFLILQADRAHAMSGSNTICVVTALLETGQLEMREPETVVTLETGGGLVRAVAECRDGKCERVTIRNVPSFADQLAVPIEVEGFGTVAIDVAYGGCFYALCDVRQIGLEMTPAGARAIVDAASAIDQAAREQVPVVHPEVPEIDFFSYVMLYGEDDPAGGLLRNCTVLPPGRIDRSPCGTGSSARLAVMTARGQAAAGDTFTARSLIGSEFRVRILETTEVAGRPAIVPEISGRGWIYGIHQIGLDPADPFPMGFTLSDTWGPGTAAHGIPELPAR